ncbi:S-adenosylmethionine decarboxylase proenzyme precursor [Pirellula sp. SH-Sr6A]|uniref:adenosylmethionine decarboxylase n=1 Tax=Pirellula sp. SH-Sr6A TaxID=1632865 RepID=UPI00078E7538|nr:adenosylmethionine decarboxylase [Pirellula sp. SH-Sr6A]AMV35028.1 S-adenosylmethionine decarboxylase proenzyme precursor [Pirellula sp. SH-Sr6A]
MSTEEKLLGRHWFLDLSGCLNIPDTPEQLEQIICEAVLLSGATIVQRCFHAFSPYGLTGVVVIAESHVAVHTWPEHQAICIDYFSCSERIGVQRSFDYLIRAFQPHSAKQSTSERRVAFGPTLKQS